MNLTRERIERAAVENQFMNGKIAAVQVMEYALACPSDIFTILVSQSYKSLLDTALAEHFPELTPHLEGRPTSGINGTNGTDEPPSINGKVEPK
jgi:mediator of RNA polymerase II transcription subunit 10